MKSKFIISISIGSIWFIISLFFAILWSKDLSYTISNIYVWWVIIGIALLPGLLMSTMFISNLLHWKCKKYSDTNENTTVIMCAHNEDKNITKSIQSIFEQKYIGNINLIVVDNASTDYTKKKIMSMLKFTTPNCSLKYIYCNKIGKSHALNYALSMVSTKYFITVDADTCLDKYAVQRIMNHIVYKKSACVAGNLFVKNVKTSFATKMQTYDYLLSISAIKRFQGAYNSTLVAQGAFSAYQTQAIRQIGGWQNMMGEDIVLTYALLSKGMSSTYEPTAVGYTTVPETLNDLYNQRKRWAIGMIEGLSFIPPWRQGTVYSKYFTFINLSVIYLDLAFLFGFIPGLILAFLGYYFFVGLLTIFSIIVCILLYMSMYLYQKKLKIYFENSISGFLYFLLFFQTIQSLSSLHGYLIRLFHRKEQWK